MNIISAERKINEILNMEKYQNDGTFLVAKIEVLLHQGKVDEAIGYFKVLKDRDDILEKILGGDEVLFTLNNIGVSQVLNKDYKGAEESFRNLQNLLETSGNLSSEIVTIKNKKYPIYTIAVNNLSIAMNKLENYSGAEKELHKLISKDIANYMTHNNLAITYLKLNDFDNALKSIDKALSLDPGNEMLLQNKEKVLQQKSAEERFIQPQLETIEKTVNAEHAEHAKNAEDETQSLTCDISDVDDKIIQANTEADNRNYIEAERTYERILDCDTNNIKAKVGLAYVYTERSKIDEAEKLYFEVLLVEPNTLLQKRGKATCCLRLTD